MLNKAIITIFCISFYSAIQGLAQQKGLKFNKLALEDGLSNNSISCFMKDSRGFIWIGTVDGLNCYDGYKFTIYKHDPVDSNSISDNLISSIVEDFEGNLWIGTQGKGLNKYDPILDNFSRFYHEPINSNSLASNYIFHHQSMLIDKDTVLWLGTDRGLSSFYINKGEFVNYQFDHPGFENTDINNVRTIAEDLNDNIWIGTNHGLLKFNKKNKTIEVGKEKLPLEKSQGNIIITSLLYHEITNDIWIGTEEGLKILSVDDGSIRSYFNNPNNPNSISDNSITNITKGNNGDVWICTKSGGLNLYSNSEDKFFNWKHSASNQYSLSDNYVDNVLFDERGFLWVGTVNDGINLANLNPSPFSILRNDPIRKNTLSNNIIRSVLKDKTGTLWIGTYGGGLNRLDGNKFTHYLHEPTDPYSISHNIISSILEDSSGELWIGTWGGGVNKMDKETGRFWKIEPELFDYVNDIVEDKYRNKWIGENGGLYIYNSKTMSIKRLDSRTDERKKLTSTSITKILFDYQGDAWIGTFEGLNKIILKDKETPEIDSIIHFTKDDLLKSNITDSRILTLFEDQSRNIWIGTYTGGLGFILGSQDLQGSFKTYTEKDGLAGNIVYGILEDKKGYVWISTNNGLSRFNPHDVSFMNFSKDNGLQSNQFYWNAYFKDPSGKMYFGGLKGLNIFHPDSVIENKTFPKVNITGFYLFNKLVTTSRKDFKRQLLKKSIIYTDEITLKRGEYPFSFEFAALMYNAQNKIKYAYKLENFDNDWLYTDASKRFAVYSHLRPGKYLFKVKSTNEYGQWNPEYRSIEVNVLPAVWETVWAYLFYILLLTVLLFIFRKQTLAWARLKHEVQIQKLEKEKSQEYNDLKLRFFTNITHEFRTPLTLITGPLENLLSSEHVLQTTKDQLSLIHSGSKRLLKLINRLLEFRKIETGNIELKVSNKNLIPLIEEITVFFNSKASENNIKYSLHIPRKTLFVWYDEYIVETIVYNLLSNAFKFTPIGGSIKLSLELLNKHEEIIQTKEGERIDKDVFYLKFSVTDSGAGIPEDKRDLIFKPFYQNSLPGQGQTVGTGIGLALCKELANRHHGTTYLDFSDKDGTMFVFKIPVHGSFYHDTEKKQDATIREVKNNQYFDEVIVKDIKLPDFAPPLEKDAPLVLIIEDDLELILFIGKILEENYRVKYAQNGDDGFKMVLAEEPDLIISDVMMPGMNGFEVCEKLKTDIRLSHIPIILLTALSTIDDRITGISTGADDYISKPFNQKLLKLRIEKLIEQRKELRKHFQKGITTLSDKDLPSVEEQFLRKVIAYIEKNIAEPDLSVESLGKEVSISSAHLNRKIKSLAGFTTNEFIRKIKLQKAASLLNSRQGNVSQVMYESGFNNSSYFAKCFQEEFGCTPTEFLNKS